MPISEAYTTNASVGTTEFSVTGNSTTVQAQTTAGAYSLVLDVNTLADGDLFEVRVYEKAIAAGTQRVARCWTIGNAQGADNGLWISPPLMLINGWDFTLKKSTGTDRTIPASIRKA